MRRTFNDTFRRVDLVVYYSFMILFSCFLSYCSIEIHFATIFYPIIGLTIAILSAIILVCLYKNVYLAVRLIPAFIIGLIALFTMGTIFEITQYHPHYYVIVMKSTLFALIILKPIEHVVRLRAKLKELSNG